MLYFKLKTTSELINNELLNFNLLNRLDILASIFAIYSCKRFNLTDAIDLHKRDKADDF